IRIARLIYISKLCTVVINISTYIGIAQYFNEFVQNVGVVYNVFKITDYIIGCVNGNCITGFVGISVSSICVFHDSSYRFICLNDILNIHNMRIARLINISKLCTVVINVSTYIGIAQYFNEFVQNVGVVYDVFKIADYVIGCVNGNCITGFVGISVSSICVFHDSSYRFICLNDILNINNMFRARLIYISKLCTVVINVSAYIGIAQYFNEFVQNVGVVYNVFKITDYIIGCVNGNCITGFVGISVSSICVFHDSSYRFICLNDILNIHTTLIRCLIYISKLCTVVINISAYIGIAQYFNEFVQNVGVVYDVFKIADYVIGCVNGNCITGFVGIGIGTVRIFNNRCRDINFRQRNRNNIIFTICENQFITNNSQRNIGCICIQCSDVVVINNSH